jgi:glycosyltransferase involved in cell wall biosynthesis
MKLCLVTPYSEEGAGGGITRHVQNVAEAAKSLGHELTILSGLMRPDSPKPAEILGCPAFYVTDAPGSTFSPSFWKASRELFTRLDSRRGFDAVLSEGSSANGLRGRTGGRPVLAFMHQFKPVHLLNSFKEISGPRSLASYALRTVPRCFYEAFSSELAFFRSADRVLCGARHIMRLAGALYRIPEERLVYTPYSIDRGAFRKDPALRKESRAALGISERDFVFLVLGRIQRTKGIDTALRAFEKFSRERPEAWLVIAGGGDAALEAELKAFAAGRKLRVLFTGMVPQGGLQGMYNAADCLIMPSVLIEVLPYVILEAVSSGLPVLASDMPGSREALGDSEGLFPSRDYEALAGLMTKAFSDEALRRRLSASASERLDALFSPDGFRQALSDSIKAVI